MIDYINYGYILENGGNKYARFCHWFPTTNIDSLNATGTYTYTPIYQNLTTLVQEIIRDSAEVVLAASPLNKYLEYEQNQPTWPRMLANNAFNNSLFSVIASKSNMAFVNLRYEDLDSTVWLDDCHTNAYGNYQIAKATSLVLQQVIETRILASP